MTRGTWRCIFCSEQGRITSQRKDKANGTQGESEHGEEGPGGHDLDSGRFWRVQDQHIQRFRAKGRARWFWRSSRLLVQRSCWFRWRRCRSEHERGDLVRGIGRNASRAVAHRNPKEHTEECGSEASRCGSVLQRCEERDLRCSSVARQGSQERGPGQVDRGNQRSRGCSQGISGSVRGRPGLVSSDQRSIRGVLNRKVQGPFSLSLRHND